MIIKQTTNTFYTNKRKSWNEQPPKRKTIIYFRFQIFFTDFSYIRDFLYTKKNTKYTVLKYNIERNFKKEIEKYTIQNDVDEVKEISNTNNKYITNECISLSERLKSATECAKLLNITPCKFGRITNKLNLKTPEYGGYFKEVLSNNREVQTFKYKEKILDVVKNYLYN